MRLTIIAATLAVATLAATAQTAEKPHFLTIEETPRDTIFIAPPPQFGSLLMQHDLQMYQWGKTMRATERGQQAVSDADTSPDNLCRVFSEAFGHELSAEATPEIYRLVMLLKEDAGTYATRCTKNKYRRTRPFVLFGEPSAVPRDEERLRNNGSYVSGHSAMGVAVAQALASINPSRQNEIFARGMEYGRSRIIVGYHWASDVQAGQLCGAMLMPALYANEGFLKQLERAKKEFKKLK